MLIWYIPNEAANWHNLGQLYHSQARFALKKGNTEEYQLKLQETKRCFVQGIALSKNSSILTEYAHFLLMNAQAQCAKEYLIKALALKEDRKVLSYGEMEKPTVSQELQQEIELSGKIGSQAYIFAYYYLIRHYKALGLSKIELEKYLGEFKTEVIKAADAFSYPLLGYCYQHLEKYNQAEQAFEQAFEINPNYSLAKENYLACKQSKSFKIL